MRYLFVVLAMLVCSITSSFAQVSVSIGINLPVYPQLVRVPGYPVTPALFVLAAAAIVVNAMISAPGRAAVGLLGVATGLPAYFLWRGTNKKTIRPIELPSDA